MSRLVKRNKIYHLHRMVNGKCLRMSLGVTTQKDAVELQREIDARDARDRFGVCLDMELPFCAVLDKFIEYSRANHAKTTNADYEYAIRSHFAHYFADYTVCQINSALIEDFKASLKPHRSKATVNKQLRYLKSIVSFGKNQGMIPESSRVVVKAFKVNEKRGRALSIDEIRRIKEQSGNDGPLLMTALYTGLRMSEVLNLKWSNIDFNAKELTVLNTEDFHTKSYRNRTIPMSEALCEYLLELKKRTPCSEFLFLNRYGNPLKDGRYVIQRIIKKTGIDYFTFHDLRRSFATLLGASQPDIKAVQELLGHQDIRTTMQYLRVSEDRRKKVITHLPY